ncbi:hypothetical protein ABPG72_020773 [Tetrahymena utriculariae]
MQYAELFESFDIIGPKLEQLYQILQKLNINETNCFQEMGLVNSQTHYKLGFEQDSISDSNQYDCNCEQEDCRICKQNLERNQFIFPDGVTYSVYICDGESKIPDEISKRINNNCKIGLQMKENFHLRREGLFFCNNKRDNLIFERKSYDTNGLVNKYNSTKKLFFVGQKIENFIYFEYDNIQIKETFSSQYYANGSYKKIRIFIFFEVAYVFCTIFPVLMLFEAILFKFHQYVSDKRCYFINSDIIHKKDYIFVKNNIFQNPQLIKAFCSLKAIRPDQDQLIQCCPESEFQIGKFHLSNITNPLSKWIYVNMFKYLPLDLLINILVIALTEQKLFICSQNITLLTSFMIGLEYLFKPLDYQSQFIYCIPQQFVTINLKDIPIPIVFGIHSGVDRFLNQTKIKKQQIQDFFVVDLDFKIIISSDSNNKKIQQQRDFITQENKTQLKKLFLTLQPHTKEQSFLRKLTGIIKTDKKYQQQCEEQLSQFILKFEFTPEEYETSHQILEIFYQILQINIIEPIIIRNQNVYLNKSSQRLFSKIEDRSVSCNTDNIFQTNNNFFKTFKDTQIYQSIQNFDSSQIQQRNSNLVRNSLLNNSNNNQ